MVTENKDNKNVYIGNRYVPKHVGVWEQTKEYESLTVVLWEGSSYTSKKSVPAGIDISNDEYWGLSANFNGQIDNYRREVELNNDKVDTVSSELLTYKELADNTLTDLNSYKQTNDDQVDNIKNEILQGRKSTLKDKTFDVLDDRLEEIELNITQHAVNPDQFEGNDLQKLQQAIDFVINSIEVVGIRLHRMFNITGLGSLKINQSHINRKPIYLFGEGGGIIKNDTGYILDSDEWRTGDIHTSHCRFESVEGGNTTFLNGDKIIRYFDVGSTFNNVDKVVKAAGYLQSIYLNQTSIVGGLGYAITFNAAYDVHFNQILVEHRDSFIHQTKNGGENTKIFTFTITDSVIEGLRNNAMLFDGVIASINFDGLYLEKNALNDVTFNTGSYINIANFTNITTSNEHGTENKSSFLKLKGTHEMLKLSNVFGVGLDHYLIDAEEMAESWNIIHASNVKPSTKERLITERGKNKIILETSFPMVNILPSANNYQFKHIPLGNFQKITGVINIYSDVRGYFEKEYDIGYKPKADDIITAQVVLYRNETKNFALVQAGIGPNGNLLLRFNNEDTASLVNADVRVNILTSLINEKTGGVAW